MSSPDVATEHSSSVDVANHTDGTIQHKSALHTIPLQSPEDDINERKESNSPVAVDEFKKKVSVFNPYEFETKRLGKSPVDVKDTLKTSALEIFVEFFGMTRVELFGKPEYMAAIYNEGAVPATWQFLDKGNPMPSSPHMRCLTRFRLPAATEIDRSESYRVCLFTPENIPTDDKQQLNQIIPRQDDSWVYTQFKVSEGLQSDPMILDRRLLYTRSGELAKGNVSISFDFIHPIDLKCQPRRVKLDFGFLDGSPRRNRMYFELAKALKRGKWCPIHKSEVRCHEDAAMYSPFTVDSQDLNSGEINRMIRIEVYRWYKNGTTKLLGFVQTTFERMIALKTNDQLYWWPAEDGISAAKVIVREAKTSDMDVSLSLRMTSMF